MKVAIVQAGLSAGGAERVVNLLAEDRRARGDQVHVFAFAQPEEESYFSYHPSIVIHRLADSQHRILNGLGVVRSMHRLLILRAAFKSLRPDVVISFLTKINVLTLIATLGLDLPTIISERNNPQLQQKHWFWRVISELIIRKADALVMQTLAITKTLPDRLRQKAVVIANPCRVSATVGISNHSDLVVAVGRLVEQKGFDTLTQAFALLAAEFPSWSLKIYGDGPERGCLQNKIISLSLEDRIFLPGVTEQPGQWVDGASIFVLSSRYEGFPNVLVEGMAKALPVVSTDCPFGPSEIIEPNISGLLVPVDDADKLAAAMRQLMKDESLRGKMGASAQKAISKFAFETIMDKWDACIRDVLSAKRTNREVRQTDPLSKEVTISEVR